MATKKLKFPVPKDYPAKYPIILCPARRVIGLYNQETSKSAKRIAKNMKKWFSDAAAKEGWEGCHFAPEVQSRHGAGAILLNPSLVRITVTQIIIQRPQSDDAAEPE